MKPCASGRERLDCIPFLGLEFKPLTIDDQAELEPRLARWPHPLSGYTFATFVAWDHVFHYCWALTPCDTLIVAFRFDASGPLHLMQPIGPLGPAAVDGIVRAGEELDRRLSIVGVDRAFLEQHPEFVSHFEVREERENANYIYRARELAELRGRRFAKKRNLLSQAAQAYRWTVEPMTGKTAHLGFQVMERMAAEMDEPMSDSMEQDNEALRRTLFWFERLSQQGLLVRIEGAPAGFALFERQGPETLVIHFERALRDYKGLYQVVNRAVAETAVQEGYDWINREEDLGDPGLRQAKMSYHPVRIEMAYRLDLRR